MASTPGINSALALTRHLRKPSRVQYWKHLLIPHIIGLGAFYLAVRTKGVVRGVAFVCCALAWYRSIVFIHEVVHFRSRIMRGFRIGWNLLVGIPFWCPSFLYLTHLEHHSHSVYGTEEDGEYIPWGVKPPVHIVQFVLASAFAPVVAAIRFAIVFPLTLLFPGLRSFIEDRASAMVIHPRHRRRKPNPRERREWVIQEFCTFAWVWCELALSFSHTIAWRWLATFVGIIACISLVNAVRTVLSHRFRHAEGPVTFAEQIQDSVNHPEGGLFTELICPVGLRFHALHHMLPSLPFHALPEAHRLLMDALPQDALYRSTNSASLWSTMRVLWADSRRY
jgi:fatty acid desaturase